MELDPQASVTPLWQLPFFIEFLKTCHLFDGWVNDFELNFYISIFACKFSLVNIGVGNLWVNMLESAVQKCAKYFLEK